MNDQHGELIIEGGPTQVNALLLPVAHAPLLVPMAAVAEVAKADMPITPLQEEQESFYGWISWRNQRLPLLSFEGISGSGKRPLTGASRLVILNAIGVAAPRGFYGLVLEGFPRPVKISSTQDGQHAEKMTGPPGVLYNLVVNTEEVLIPDFDLFEALSFQAPLPRGP